MQDNPRLSSSIQILEQFKEAGYEKIFFAAQSHAGKKGEEGNVQIHHFIRDSQTIY
jgi:hypothetical protein